MPSNPDAAINRDLCPGFHPEFTPGRREGRENAEKLPAGRLGASESRSGSVLVQNIFKACLTHVGNGASR